MDIFYYAFFSSASHSRTVVRAVDGGISELIQPLRKERNPFLKSTSVTPLVLRVSVGGTDRLPAGDKTACLPLIP